MALNTRILISAGLAILFLAPIYNALAQYNNNPTSLTFTFISTLLVTIAVLIGYEVYFVIQRKSLQYNYAWIIHSSDAFWHKVNREAWSWKIAVEFCERMHERGERLHSEHPNYRTIKYSRFKI